MREVEFKLERKELLDEVKSGEIFEIKEYKIANSYYYVLGHSYAMSANFPVTERIKDSSGKVKEVKDTPRGFYITMLFEQ